MATREERPESWTGSIFDPSAIPRMKSYLKEVERMNERIEQLSFTYIKGYHTFSFNIPPEERNEWTDVLLDELSRLVDTIESDDVRSYSLYRGQKYHLWMRGFASLSVMDKIGDNDGIVVTIGHS